MFYDFMDKACAESQGRAEIILKGLVTASMNEDIKLLEKVRRIFNLID